VKFVGDWKQGGNGGHLVVRNGFYAEKLESSLAIIDDKHALQTCRRMGMPPVLCMGHCSSLQRGQLAQAMAQQRLQT
jgi:hypothetical protein